MTSTAAEPQAKRYLLPPVALTIEIGQLSRTEADVTLRATSGAHCFVSRTARIRYDACDSIDALAEAHLYRWVAWLLGFERQRRSGQHTMTPRAWSSVPGWPAQVGVADTNERAQRPRQNKRTEPLRPDPDPF